MADFKSCDELGEYVEVTMSEKEYYYLKEIERLHRDLIKELEWLYSQGKNSVNTKKLIDKYKIKSNKYEK